MPPIFARNHAAFRLWAQMQAQHLHHVSSPLNGYCASYAKCKFGSHDPLQTFHNWSRSTLICGTTKLSFGHQKARSSQVPVVSVQCGIAALESVAYKGTKPWNQIPKSQLTQPVSRRSSGGPFSWRKCSSQQLQKERLQLLFEWLSQLEISLESLSRCWRPRPSKAKLLFSCTFLLMPIWWRLLKIVVLSKLLLNYTQGGSPCESQVPNSIVPHVQILNYCYSYRHYVMLFLLSSWSLSVLLVQWLS